ncbi:hypothetical protein Pfo_003355 [Paulownia fortunei]|nr:hypothetical protein Pfo_003355 [Paulownia fortunei]
MVSSSSKSLAVTITIMAIAVFGSFCEASFGEVKDATLLDTICRQSNVQPFYEFCVQLLNSDPRGLTSNLTGMAQVALELDIKEALSTLVSIDDMARAPGTDTTMKIYLLKCSDRYAEIASLLQQASGDLAQGLLQGVRDSALSAGSKAQDCETTFNGPPLRLSPISSNNAEVNDLGIIVAAIIDLLRT